MNKGCSIAFVSLVLSGLAGVIVTPQNGLGVSLSKPIDDCHRASLGFAGRASLLQYYNWLRSASAAEQASQHKCAISMSRKGEPRGKLVLALTLILPGAPFSDFERAHGLIGEILQDAGKESTEDRALAALMDSLLNEVARLEEQLEQLKAIEKDITETEQSVNVPTPAPAEDDEQGKDDTSGGR